MVKLVGKVDSLAVPAVRNEHVGFFWSENSPPALGQEDQQVRVLIREDGSFTGLAQLTPETQYYLAAFVADEEAYYTSEVAEFLMPYPQPPTVPCTIPVDNFVILGSSYSINSIVFREIWDEYELRMEGSFASAFIKFNELPSNRTYTSTNFSFFNNGFADNVYITVRAGFNTYSVKEGAEVYVSEKVGGSFQVEICNSIYRVGSSDIPFQLNALVP